MFGRLVQKINGGPINKGQHTKKTAELKELTIKIRKMNQKNEAEKKEKMRGD